MGKFVSCSIPRSLGDFIQLKECGGIDDVGLGLRWDAATLEKEVLRRAVVLGQMGIKPGSVAAIGHGGTAQFFADLFACWRVGAAAACLDPSLTPGELRNVVDFAKPAVFLAGDKTIVDGLQVPTVNLSIERSQNSSVTALAVAVDGPALVLFTSGTTGTPKGVVLSFRALLARIASNIEAIGTAPLARTLVSLPTHFGHGLIGNSLTPLFAGGNILLHPLGTQMANDLGRIIDDFDITFMSSVPSLWRIALGRSRQPSRGSLVRVHVGSAPFPAALWSEVAAWSGAEVVNCYGTTETANWIAGASNADGIADGLIGKMWGGQARVIDDNGSIQTHGAGEILIKSSSLMSGYLNRPDLSAAALHQGWYRTGDRGSIDQQGRLWLTGRLKDEINRAGFKVQPAEIDALLEKNPDVAEACVFGINDALGGEAIAAAIRLADGATANSQSLQAWCRERLRREAVPESWFFVSEIPRTSRGKVSRDAVRRALVKETAASANSDSPNLAAGVISKEDLSEPVDIDSVRTAVKFAWTKILGHASYEADVPLLEADADSLDVVRMWLLIEKALGRHMSMDVLNFEPTPAQLAALLEQQIRASSQSSHSSNVPLVFLMPPAGGDLPTLAGFRAALKGKLRFVLIQYPDWSEMIDAGAGFDALAEAAVAQICAQSPENEPCLLAGYSFGGLVAIEATRRLLQRGRRVGFLGLIDTRAVNPLPVDKRLRRFLARKPKALFGLPIGSATKPATGPYRTRDSGPPSRWQSLISALILMSAFRTLKLVGQLAACLPAKQASTADLMISLRLRTESLRRLHLEPIAVPLTLFRSNDDASPDDNGWKVLCNDVTLVPIGGTHELMFNHPFLDILCTRFFEAIESASCSVK
jgi:acyl-CoA synthetase (AMP-forming)/AMP-acid ligase II/thioesterase domain-containing protein